MKALKACRGSGDGDGEHRFVKFDDTSVVCERCAERRVVAEAPEAPPPVYVPYIYPYLPYIPPTWPYVRPNWWEPRPWPQYQIWSDTGGGNSYQPPDTVVIS